MCKYAYRVCSASEFGERGGSVGKSIVPVSYSSVETSNSSLDKSSIHSNVWESNVRDSSGAPDKSMWESNVWTAAFTAPMYENCFVRVSRLL